MIKEKSQTWASISMWLGATFGRLPMSPDFLFLDDITSCPTRLIIASQATYLHWNYCFPNFRFIRSFRRVQLPGTPVSNRTAAPSLMAA